jgi:hypothetical protein
METKKIYMIHVQCQEADHEKIKKKVNSFYIKLQKEYENTLIDIQFIVKSFENRGFGDGCYKPQEEHINLSGVKVG